MAKSNVVIVGGGGYGIKMASSLSTKLDPSKHTLTLISSREFFLHLPAMLRLMVTGDEQIRTTAMMPYDRLFKRVGTYLRGTVIEIKKNAGGKSGTVILDSGKELPWDILLLAPGNKWEGGLRIPETHEEVKIFIEEWRQRFEKANKITLVGGGPVGIELSGELREYYPNKKITLAHAEDHLINAVYPLSFRKGVEKKLRSRNIEVLLNTRVEDIPADGLDGSVKTTDGKTINSDLVVPTRGGRPNTDFVNSLSPNLLKSTGHVKVKNTLQLVSETNILAVGDCSDIKEVKQLGKAAGYSELAANNILALLNGKSDLKEYKGQPEGIFITIGKRGGAGWLDMLWGLRFGDWSMSYIKSKGLFIDLARKELGQPLVG